MIKRILGCSALLGCWLMAGSSLWAHHSLAGVYDMKAEKEVSGTVDKLQFTLGSATALAGRGVGKTGPNALHVGDAIKVKCIPAKDGHPLGFLKAITYPDGHTVVVSGGGPND